MLPALGGKLNSTTATRRSARSDRRRLTSRATRAASIPARLLMRHHLAAMAFAGGGPAAEGHRPDAAIEFRDRHHHGGLDRHQAARVRLPLLQGLEFDRMGRDVGHVEARQDLIGRFGIVVGGTADEARSP